MIKNFSYLIFVAILFSSCYTASYKFSPISSRHNVSYEGEGNWLFISHSAPGGFAMDASELAYNEFKKIVGSNLFHFRDTRGLMGINNIKLQPDRNQLKELKNTTGFDYIIHLRFSNRNSDIDGIMIGRDKELNIKNEVLTVLEIYDLNNLAILNIQEVVGTVKILENRHDVSYVESTEIIARRSVKKIMRKLR